MCKAKSYTTQLLEIYNNIDADINSLCKEEKMANLFDQDMLHMIENTNFNACDGYKLAKQLRENRIHRRKIKNELDTLLRLKVNIIDPTFDILNDQHQKIILRDNYLKSLVENKTYNPKIIGVENPEIRVNKPIIREPKPEFVPIPVPSTPPKPKQQELPIILGDAIHKKNKMKLQVISKLDDGHYLCKAKNGYQVLCSKHIINIDLSQSAK